MDPQLPLPNSTVSYWQVKKPSKMWKHRSTPELPAKAFAVVIGSGLTGASAAYHLSAKHPDGSILLLEAREACSGATSRNGGHLVAANFFGIREDARRLGADAAVRVRIAEHMGVQELVAKAKQLGSGDLVENGRVRTYEDPATYSEAVADYHWAVQAGVAYGAEIWDATETYRRLRTPAFVGAGKVPGFQFYPADFVWKLLEEAVAKQKLNFQTETPVTDVVSVEHRATDGYRWKVITPRGSVLARHVVHCTNAWAGHLLPSLRPYITPTRGQVIVEYLPQQRFPYGLSFRNGNVYLQQRPFDHMIILGGGKTLDPGRGTTNDTELNPIVSRFLRDFIPAYFPGVWPLARMEWTGIMGFTAAELPFVGPMPGLDGQWLGAGYTGHGMPLCFAVGKRLAKMVESGVESLANDPGWMKEWLPEGRIGQQHTPVKRSLEGTQVVQNNQAYADEDEDDADEKEGLILKDWAPPANKTLAQTGCCAIL
ncbi:uncharacterized protein VTP21DRAFT_2600 [Calcarisporiella thermophila]|uniref:uncharacterized protein n=1 Tax=Calcarisporiella thermophila TaxID=911321 RepID=UPI0037438252